MEKGRTEEREERGNPEALPPSSLFLPPETYSLLKLFTGFTNAALMAL